MSGPLGCVNDYQAVLHLKGGATPVVRLGPLQSVTWERRLSEQSTAEVVIAKGGATRECCAALGDVSPWAYEISIYRGQDLVWQGPVRRPTETRTQFTLAASDVTGWFERRLIRRSRYYTYDTTVIGKTGPETEAVTVMEAYLRDALDPNRTDAGGAPLHGLDDINLLPYLELHYGTAKVEHSAFQGVDSLFDRLNDLADDHLDFTTVGRRVVISYPGWLYQTGAIARLQESDFSADVELAIEGDMLATRYVTHSTEYERGWSRTENGATVTPYHVTGQAVSKDSDAYGTHPYYGRVEQTAELDGATKKQSTYDGRARKFVDRSFPAPATLRVGDEAALHPHAPVGVADLVCGSRIDLILSPDVWCRPVSATSVLTGVTGQWDQGGERILVSLEGTTDSFLVVPA